MGLLDLVVSHKPIRLHDFVALCSTCITDVAQKQVGSGMYPCCRSSMSSVDLGLGPQGTCKYSKKLQSWAESGNTLSAPNLEVFFIHAGD